MTDFQLVGRVAVVTHATSNLGRGIVEALRGAGARVVLDEADEPLSVQGMAALVQQAVDQYGRVDIMVNVSVVPPSAPAEDLTFDQFSQGIQLNLTAAFFGCQAAARQMTQQPRLPGASLAGSIINVTSVAGELAIAGHAAYGAAMAGINAVTQTLATEWQPLGIRVVALGAGLTPALVDGALRLPGAAFRVPLHMMTDGAAIGPTVVYLASDAARHITGPTIYVDGGWLADGYWQ